MTHYNSHSHNNNDENNHHCEIEKNIEKNEMTKKVLF